MKQPGLQRIWSKEDLRRELTAALRAWNSAAGAARAEENLRKAADKLENLLRQGNAPDLENAQPSLTVTRTPGETPQQAIDRLLDFPGRRLAVYGSLAPGKKNHHIMAGMEGTWRKAVLRGSLRNEGWGAGQGFPGFLWDGTNTPVPAQVFTSSDLPRHWQRLDDFEGPEYRRNLVPVELLPQQAKNGLAGDPRDQGGEIEVCNVYELAEPRFHHGGTETRRKPGPV